MKNVMKVFNVIKNIILDIIIVLLCITIVISVINMNKPTSFFGYYFFTIMSGSMQPELKVNDSIIVRQSNNYNVGDIVTYKNNNAYVTHRIIKVDNDMITTQGDANTDADPEFDKNDILGKVVFKSVFLNILVKYRLLIILIIILIYVVELVVNGKKKKVENSET